MQSVKLSTYFQSQMVMIMVLGCVFLTGELPLPTYLQGTIATIITVALSIMIRHTVFGSAATSGPDLAFCAVGLQLAFFYKKVEAESAVLSLAGLDMILLLIFLCFWFGSLKSVKKTIDGASSYWTVTALALGFASIMLEIVWRWWCQL